LIAKWRSAAKAADPSESYYGKSLSLYRSGSMSDLAIMRSLRTSKFVAKLGLSMRALSFALVAVLLASPVFAASFDCARASSPREKAICASPRLSYLDDQLGATFNKLLAAVPAEAHATVRQNERDWLHSFECPANLGQEALGKCLALAWDERIRLLQMAISTSQSSGVPLLWNSVHFTQADTGDEARMDAERGAPTESTLDAEWPQALSSDPNWQAWNRAIELQTRDMASQGQAKPGDQWAKSAWMDGLDNDVSVTLGAVTPLFVGTSFQNLWYGHGAAHPNYAKLQFNWLLLQRRELAAEDVFRTGSGWQKLLYDRAMESLRAQIDPKFPENQWAPGYGEDLVSKIAKDPHYWILDTTGLTLYFPQGSISCHACGEFEVKLPWKELRPMLQAGFRI
jgi:uncharacterized protein